MTEVALALIQRGDRWFLQRRDLANPVLPGCWEFPGGKIEGGETPEEALVRELHEEVGFILRTLRPWPLLKGAVRLHPFLAEVEGEPITDLAWGWFKVDEIRRLSIPPMNAALLVQMAEMPQAAGGGSGAHPLI